MDHSGVKSHAIAAASGADTRLPRVVRQFGLISFLTDAATEMFYPILPFFLTVTLGAPVAIVGVIEGVAEGISHGLRVVAGYVADRLRRNRMLVVFGYTMSALSKPLISLAPHWAAVAGLRVSDRFGKAFRGVPRDIMIAEAVDPQELGRAFGFHRAMDTAGAVVGPLVGLGLLVWLGEDDLRAIFLLAGVPAAATLVLLRRLPRSEPPPQRRPGWKPGRLPWRGQFGSFVVITLVFSLCNSSDVFILLRAKDLGLSTTAVILAYTLFNVVYSATSLPAGIRGDRIGRLRVYRFGLLLFAFVYGGFALATSATWVWPLFALYGVHMAMTKGVDRALVIDLIPDEVRGKGLAVTQTLAGISVLLASVVAGVLYDTISPAAPFVVGAGGAVTASILLSLLVRPGANNERLESPVEIS